MIKSDFYQFFVEIGMRKTNPTCDVFEKYIQAKMGGMVNVYWNHLHLHQKHFTVLTSGASIDVYYDEVKEVVMYSNGAIVFRRDNSSVVMLLHFHQFDKCPSVSEELIEILNFQFIISKQFA